MTKAKKRLLISVAALVIAIAVATGSTFAWFTINREVNVEQMDISVTAGSQGIYVSTAKAGPYKTSLSQADLIAAGYNVNANLDALTSKDGITITERDSDVAIASTTGKFIQFKLYFRASGETVPTIDLNRTDNSVVDGKNTILQPSTNGVPQTIYNEWKDIAANEYGQTSAIATQAALPSRAAYATRVSFEAIAHDTTTKSTRIWDPYYGDANTFCGLPNADTNRYDNTNKNFAVDYYNATYAFAGSGNDPITAPIANTIAATQNKTEFFGDVLKLTENAATGFYEGELTIRIWLEGYDGDCINSVLGDKILADFVFAIRDVDKA